MPEPATTELSLIRKIRFCAGHRLYRHEGKCAHLHGHNYRVDVEVAAAGGGSDVDAVGRVVDFSVIKRRLLTWIDTHWDHAFLVFTEDAAALAAVRSVEPAKVFVMPWNPTAENMARYLLEVVAPEVLGDLGVVARKVAVWETDEACAVAAAAGR
jgi:6-pyruvoyltetrahydropterin/6-carboxytetrahydropterin synthase